MKFRHLSIYITAVVFTTAITSLAQQQAAIPGPSGFVEGSGSSEMLRRSGTNGLPSSEVLLGLYYPADALADILNRGYTAPAPFCKAVSRRYTNDGEARQGFAQLTRNAKKEMGSSLNLDNPDVQKIFKRYEDLANKTVPGVSIKVAGVSPLGITVDADTVFGGAMIANFAWSDGAAQAPMPFAVAFAYVLVGDQRIDLTVCYPFKGGDSVKAATVKLTQWMATVQKGDSTIIQKHTDTWQRFSSENGRFSILMPAKPDQKVQVGHSNDPRPQKLVYFTAGNGPDEAYSVTYGDEFDDIVRDFTTKEILDSARDGAVAGAQGKLETELFIVQDGFPGRELRVATPGPSTSIFRIFLVGHRKYCVMFITTKRGGIFSPNVDKYFDSFKFTVAPK